ncbi:KR domain protein [Leptospira inadai serovar Lyme str. 10]|uniref:KR domain protein n=2 Tax=Leptospira inadai serovar Lyme TaxID=293084 RepID=V6HHC4_9LEPT|nr:SDR family oxidoreductase [Leptospira inadai]EQA35720.1 KR domain protein [Leptospira inadai serovar Lyme str. 10]PNV76806.1 3-oxoacyl-ACP reductase [Leptospira inadai serovar Lyme]
MSKKILVAGAGTGIGRSLLEKLHALPDVEAIGISRRGVPVVQSLKAGVNYACDLADVKSLSNFCHTLRLHWNRLDALYFTFGDGLFRSVETVSLEDWEKHLALNLTAPYLLTKELSSLFGKGSLLCYLSSTAGRQGFPQSSAYCASKHGIAGFAKAIREEWKTREIRVSIVYAGAIDTPVWDGRDEFDRRDMIPVEDAADFLANLSFQPMTFNLDEIVFLPPKGIL